jgi:hypothetical protein
MWDFVMDKSGAGARFLRELRFPLPIYIPSASPQSSSLSPEAGTIGQEWPQCQQPHKPNIKKRLKKKAKNITLNYFKIPNTFQFSYFIQFYLIFNALILLFNLQPLTNYKTVIRYVT